MHYHLRDYFCLMLGMFSVATLIMVAIIMFFAEPAIELISFALR